jgi:hypothetical protein
MHLVKNGLISQNGGRWELTVDLDEVAVEAPENVVGLIEREHDRLAPWSEACWKPPV